MSAPGDALRRRAESLQLHGILIEWDRFREAPWLPDLLKVEEVERGRRSLERRLRSARLGRFKPLADFDWDWPARIDREHLDELFKLEFLEEGISVILVGPNGVGKTMIAKNLAHAAIHRGYTARLASASEVLGELAAQESASALSRCLRKYTRPKLLVIDEIGYLSYDNRHADLLFELVSRRYAAGDRSLVITTNRSFKEWDETFPNATCVVTLVDRLVHRSEILDIEGKSYRLKEATEQQAARAKARAAKKNSRKKKAGGTRKK